MHVFRALGLIMPDRQQILKNHSHFYCYDDYTLFDLVCITAVVIERNEDKFYSSSLPCFCGSRRAVQICPFMGLTVTNFLFLPYDFITVDRFYFIFWNVQNAITRIHDMKK